MRIGMIGLGKMGANMTERLLKGGHEVVAFDLHAEARDAVAAKGAEPATSLKELAGKLTAPRAAWVMVPAGAATNSTIDELATYFEAGDVIRICDLDGTEFARGIAKFSAEEIRQKKPARVELVHRDDLVIL